MKQYTTITIASFMYAAIVHASAMQHMTLSIPTQQGQKTVKILPMQQQINTQIEGKKGFTTHDICTIMNQVALIKAQEIYNDSTSDYNKKYMDIEQLLSELTCYSKLHADYTQEPKNEWRKAGTLAHQKYLMWREFLDTKAKIDTIKYSLKDAEVQRIIIDLANKTAL
jgi:hypothetical protein